MLYGAGACPRRERLRSPMQGAGADANLQIAERYANVTPIE